jgi:DNA gyrase subunit A
MERSYLEYAMSVIVGRALPDVRDGLKPVHRRILYAMHELGLTSDRPYRKCARVVGDVLGKYHPHGDQAVYDALVRMVQDFSSRYPLLDGHGNFGSVDNDPPAAMRYTETRLSPVADLAMLSEIGEATVDFSNNFDNSQQEPVVLPAQLPILLLNGCAGIAVGMATNIPPHNLGEVVDGLIALIDKSELADEQLWELIPGPDFPTGGEIVDWDGIKEAYSTGRGIIRVRGIVQTEQLIVGRKRRKEITAIVVTELPYQVNKAGWIEKVAELVNQGRLEGIADIRDESDRDGMRVVIELKKDILPQKILRQLYKQTALESNFGVIMLALVNNKPCQLPLRELLEHFLEFREETLRRQYGHELEQAQQRLHLVSGLLAALNNIDSVIDILRNAPDGTTAKYSLTEELNISEVQADSILAMPMRRLTGLERQKLETESTDLEERIAQLENILGDRHELLKALKKELRSLKRKFGDERRTRIVKITPSEKKVSQPTIEQNENIEDTVRQPRQRKSKNSQKAIESKVLSQEKTESASTSLEEEIQTSVFNIERSPEAAIAITNEDCIYWENPTNNSEPPPTSLKIGEDFVIASQPIANREQLIIVTDSGKAYPLGIENISPKIAQIKQRILSLLPGSAQRDAQKTVAQFFMPESEENTDLILLTEQGRIKRIQPTELEGLGNRGLALIKLKEQDRLQYLCFTQEDREMAIATCGGRILRFTVNDAQLPLMGRSAQGNQALRLRYGETLAGCVTLTTNQDLLLVSQLGYGKRIPVNTLRLGNLGDIGTQAMQFTNKTDNLAAMILAKPEVNLVLTTTANRRLLLPLEEVRFWGKDGTGNQIVNLKAEERIINVYLLV